VPVCPQLLPRATISDVLEAIERAEIDCDDLLDMLPPGVLGTLPKGRSPKASLSRAVRRLNTWLPIDGGEVPLRVLLDAARDLCGPRRERAIIESALVELLDGSTIEHPTGRRAGARELFYKRARDSFEASGCEVLTDSPHADTFIACRASIVSVVAVSVDSLEHTIAAVRREVAHVRRFESYVEGCVVLPLNATSEQRHLVEMADLRAIEAKELRGMDIQDVEAVVHAQLAKLGEAEAPASNLVESAYRDFRTSQACLLAVAGGEQTIAAECSRFVRSRAAELLTGLGDCAPLWLRLTEPLPGWVEDLAIAHFRESGIRCSSLGLRRLMNERVLLPVFQTTRPPRRRDRPVELVSQALGPPARAVLFTATAGPCADLAEMFQVPADAVRRVALPD
jgi:hypothetical protein